jgi:hypothetical protein
MENNSSGFQNTATGYKALHLNTTGKYNTANGGYALYNNSSGSLNGDYNTASGYAALYNNVEGKYNTACGYNALYTNTGAYSNTGVGYSVMLNTSEGSYNTAVGTNALEKNISGDYNIAIGVGAGNDGNNNSHNISIGFNAHIATGVSNSIVLGDNAFTNTNNLALLGNTTTLYCGGYAGWTTYVSDGRLKTGVNEDVKGLDFIMRLRPVTYNINVKAIYDLQGLSPYGKENEMTAERKSAMDKSIADKEAIRTSGFIAQEVEKAANETGYDFDGVKKPAHEKDNYGITYSSFVVPLVKAVQEQQQAMIAMQKRIELLEEQNKILLKLLGNKKFPGTTAN